MRLTQVLGKQHIKRWFVRKWYVEGKNKRVPIDSNAESTLTSLGIKLTDPKYVFEERFGPRVPPESLNIVGLYEKQIPMDENHPMHHDRPCFMYKENSILVEGLAQAQNLTNTVILHSGLPEKIEELAKENDGLLHEECDEQVKKCIIRSFLFDAVQEKLPKIKDPERPAYKFPPVFGVPDYRRNRVMSENLLSICDSFSMEPHGIVVRDAKLRTLLDINRNLINFNISPAMLVCGKNPMKAYTEPARTENLDLPDIFPLQPFASLSQNKFYEDTELINIPTSNFVHTAVFHFNDTTNTNLTEVPVNENQIQGRTLANSFITALALAKHKQENATGELATPVTIQGVHTNGKWFQFSIYQLNNVGTEGAKNVAWLSPIMSMFETAGYEKGVPSMLGYNPLVFRYLFAFHRNSLLIK
ncbi:large ribosomal subunit protein mL37 [Cloeon dipterum]|uniref:large ribosomal subunit protein mL37 n=1 Tax=Cloeon dipterum TaxID=197152 RepID=UPI00321FAB5E